MSIVLLRDEWKYCSLVYLFFYYPFIDYLEIATFAFLTSSATNSDTH